MNYLSLWHIFLFQETEPLWHRSESQVSDQAAAGLPDSRVSQPHIVPGPAQGHEEDVPQQGGRGQPHSGYQRRQVRPEGCRVWWWRLGADQSNIKHSATLTAQIPLCYIVLHCATCATSWANCNSEGELSNNSSRPGVPILWVVLSIDFCLIQGVTS